MTTLVAGDYRRALEFLRLAHESDIRAPFSAQVLTALRRLIPCAIASYRELDERTRSYGQWASGIEVSEAESIWSRYPDLRDQDPLPGVCPDGRVRGRLGRSAQISDFLSLAGFRRLDLYEQVCRPLGTNFVMKLFLPVRGLSAGFVLESDRRDFTRRDREVLDLIAPHLALLCERRGWASARSIADAMAATLTERECEVLELVARGLTNPEIGSVLFLSPGTVRKHLDNVYRKLGVRNRAEAVAVVLSKSRQLA